MAKINFNWAFSGLVLGLVVLCGCTTGSQDIQIEAPDQLKHQFYEPTSWPRVGSKIEITYCWGNECRNRIDTISGTLTKDLIRDPAITVPFELSQKQKVEIVAYADSIMFWHWPNSLYNKNPEGIVGITSPCSKNVLQIRQSHRTKTVVWDNCKTNPNNPLPLIKKIEPLGKLIQKMVKESETFKGLPPSRGSYL